VPLHIAGIGILTIVLCVIVLWSVFAGIRMGFASELGHVILQVGYLISAIVSIWLAWRWMNVVATRIAGWHPAGSPTWLNHFISLWQSAPQAGRVIAFIVFYILISAVLHAIIRPVAALASHAVPGLLARNQVLGGALGLVSGVIRSVFLGAILFGVLHYFSVPWLNQLVSGSKPYQYASRQFYTPYLSPVLDKELPVLGKDATQLVSKNISLFVIPSTSASQRGVLIVPKQISNLAKQITVGDHSTRQKAYALYEWEIHHIRYDWTKYYNYVDYGKWDGQTPLQTVETGKGVCADYALLYAEMAHAVGLTVQIDEGMGGTPGNEGSHAWNEVWDSSAKRWITVDTTWGASQDKWFDAPGFFSTHFQQKAITIQGASA
jgi:uncharacterized membrane protein required for colicin V production